MVAISKTMQQKIRAGTKKENWSRNIISLLSLILAIAFVLIIII